MGTYGDCSLKCMESSQTQKPPLSVATLPAFKFQWIAATHKQLHEDDKRPAEGESLPCYLVIPCCITSLAWMENRSWNFHCPSNGVPRLCPGRASSWWTWLWHDHHDPVQKKWSGRRSEFQTVEPGQTAYSTAVKSLLFRRRVIKCKKYRRQTSNPRFLSLPDRANNGLLHALPLHLNHVSLPSI